MSRLSVLLLFAVLSSVAPLEQDHADSCGGEYDALHREAHLLCKNVGTERQQKGRSHRRARSNAEERPAKIARPLKPLPFAELLGVMPG